MVSMLFVSVEGVAESVDDNSFHQTHHAHADDMENNWFPDSDGDDHTADSCEHFCHLHALGLIVTYTAPDIDTFQFFQITRFEQGLERTVAPPTPPPNA